MKQQATVGGSEGPPRVQSGEQELELTWGVASGCHDASGHHPALCVLVDPVVLDDDAQTDARRSSRWAHRIEMLMALMTRT